MGLMLMKFERLRKLFIRSLAVGGILSAMSVAARAEEPRAHWHVRRVITASIRPRRSSICRSRLATAFEPFPLSDPGRKSFK